MRWELRTFAERVGVALAVALFFFILLSLVRGSVEEVYQEAVEPFAQTEEPLLRELRVIREKINRLERRMNERGKSRGNGREK